jgi:hypothetical protein
VLDAAIPRVGAADRVRDGLSVLAVVVGWSVERGGAVGRCRLSCLEKPLDGYAHAGGGLHEGRLASEREGDLVLGAIEPDREVLEIARRPNRPRLVGEVALDLAERRGHGEQENAVTRSRSRSKRSISSPTDATCTRSSSGSLPP